MIMIISVIEIGDWGIGYQRGCIVIEYSSEKSGKGLIKRITTEEWRRRGNKFSVGRSKGGHVKGDCFQLSLAS
jgi:hypothetical protein